MRLTNINLTLATLAMEEKNVKLEGSGKGGGQLFHSQNFNKKEPMSKALTLGLKKIFFSYGQPKDAAIFIKSKKAFSGFFNVNLKVGVPMAARAILSVTGTDLKVPEYPNDKADKCFPLKW